MELLIFQVGFAKNVYWYPYWTSIYYYYFYDICVRSTRVSASIDEANYIRSGLEPPNHGLPMLKNQSRSKFPGEPVRPHGLEGGPRFGGGVFTGSPLM